MPFTPLHLGPGIAVKAVLRNRMSLGMFAATQIAMDIEPAIAMFAGVGDLHGLTHTVAGAAVIGTLCLPLKRLAEWHLKMRIGWRPAIVGVYVGAFTHIMFDALVHAEMRPLWPLSGLNPFFGLLGWHATELLCVALAAPAFAYLPAAWRWLRAMPLR